MRISDKGLGIITHFEGLSAKPYVCPAGYLTIGYGHLVKENSPHFVTKAQALELLKHDVAIAEQAVKRLISAPLTQYQFDALVSFTFNVGAGALQRSSLRACANRGDFFGASEQFLRWVYGGGRKLKGLILRRNAEKMLFLGG